MRSPAQSHAQSRSSQAAQGHAQLRYKHHQSLAPAATRSAHAFGKKALLFNIQLLIFEVPTLMLR